jgi:hypothetical protein
MITVNMLKYQADTQLYVVKEVRRWAMACVRSLYGALSVINQAYRLDECHQRLFAFFLAETDQIFDAKNLLLHCMNPKLGRHSALENERMRPQKLPPWPTAIVPGPTMLDPYLNLRRGTWSRSPSGRRACRTFPPSFCWAIFML